MNVEQTMEMLDGQEAEKLLEALYGRAQVQEQKERYREVLKGYRDKFGDGEVKLFTSPGRTEISGNHTDHNHGKVLAGSINLDCVGAAAANHSAKVRIVSVTFGQEFTVDLNNLAPSRRKAGTEDLVKGLLKGFQESGYEVGGFDAYITSNVISAAGVSSSASFEMLLCSMINTLFNDGRMSTVAYAHIGKYAENNYWDKASGLLDQMACAVGGLITIDFMEPSDPKVEKIDFDFDSQNHSLIIVQTGRGHADLSADYSAVPAEMKKVAEYFGKEYCSEITEKEVIDNLAKVREYAGDRSVLRALHFFEENKRVEIMVKALKEGRFDVFLENIHCTTEEEVTVVIARISCEQLNIEWSVLIVKIQCIYQVLALFLTYFVVIKCCIIGYCIGIHKKTVIRDNRNSFFFGLFQRLAKAASIDGCHNQKVTSVCYLVLKLGNLCAYIIGCILKVYLISCCLQLFLHVIAILVPSLEILGRHGNTDQFLVCCLCCCCRNYHHTSYHCCAKKCRYHFSFHCKILRFIICFWNHVSFDDVTITQDCLDIVGKDRDIFLQKKNALHQARHFCTKNLLLIFVIIVYYCAYGYTATLLAEFHCHIYAGMQSVLHYSVS